MPSSTRVATIFSIAALALPSLTNAQEVVSGGCVSNPSCETCASDCESDGCHSWKSKYELWKCKQEHKCRHLRTWLCKGCCTTTGDLYPHYPYFPEQHGYYDFAPYNASYMLIQRRIAAQMGETLDNPYARAMYPEIYSMLPNTAYPGMDDVALVPKLPRVEPALPDLEAMVPTNEPPAANLPSPRPE